MQKKSFFDAPLALGLPGKDTDILNAKRLFNQIGRLTEPPRGFNSRFDHELDDAVRAFQRDNGILVDGRINPGGATERNIRRERGELPKEPPLNIAELDITTPIGNGLTNRPEDIIGVSKALGRLGLFNFDKTKEPSPIISHKLVDGLKELQRQHGITPTGDFKPGDKTDAVLKAAVAKIMEPRSKANEAADPRAPGKLVQIAQLESSTDASPAVEPKADDTSTKFQDTKWVPSGLPLAKGKREIKVNGSIRVIGRSPVPVFDHTRFIVDWHPLDKDGKVLPVFRKNEPLKENPMEAGQVVEQFNKPKIFEPPFDWPHGFRATISIPPQATTRRGSQGIHLQISVPEGTLLK